MTPEFVRRMSAPLPRYTSYPTAQQFTPRVGKFEYAKSLQNLSPATVLSLYIHIPFCSELCWYCGCSTKAVKSREPIRAYLDTLKIEMTKVAAFLQAPRVTHLHWGGGTPNILTASEIGELEDSPKPVHYLALCRVRSRDRSAVFFVRPGGGFRGCRCK